MKRNAPTYLILFLLMLIGSDVFAQKFSVASFRTLPNDVSAFINPVRDLNDEDCALIKVQANEDFAFSTPLGIVKRIDKTGEIWLYIPAKSKKITIKHPEWGVMRDYTFPERIDSHLTYEIVIAVPDSGYKIITQEPIIQTVRDTVVISHTDTLVLQPLKQHIPLRLSAIATIGFGGKSKTVTGGAFISLMKRHGGFIHISSDFGKVGKTEGTCGRYGEIDGYKPFYSSKTYHSFFMANAGAIHRLSSKFAIFEGVGYGSNTIAWQMTEAEGAKRVKNSYFSSKGISFELGATYTHKHLSILTSISSLQGKDWFGSLGIGISF